MSDDKRRVSDYEIIEHQAKIQNSLEGLEKSLEKHNGRLEIIETVLWGYGRGEDIGLLEKVRGIIKWGVIIGGIVSFITAAVGRLVSPLYDKAVSDWVYNSPSEKWMRETARPVHKNYRIVVKREAKDDGNGNESPDSKETGDRTK